MLTDKALTFGKLLEKLIEAEGITKTEAGARIGQSDASIHRLIGNVSSPSINRALTILDSYDYTLAVVKKGAELDGDTVLLLHAETEAERDRAQKKER